MKKFKVFASETIFYEVDIEAENYEQAFEDANSGNVEFNYKDVVDSANFEVQEVKEIYE